MTINGNRITPEEGKFLTNGETYSELVILGKNASVSEWWEVDSIPDEETTSYTEEELMSSQNAV